MPRQHQRVRALRGLIVAVILGGGLSAAAQSRETLETKVTAEGDTILLDWSKKHPWDADLLANGAFLLAEYRTADGNVALDCLDGAAAGDPGAGAPGRGVRRTPSYGRACQGLRSTPGRNRDDRTLRFHLPEGLTSVPAGPVCLYVQLPNQRLLPIRRSNQRGDDTARFRHEPWEKEAAKRSQALTLRARVDAARGAVDVRAQNVKTLEASNAAKRWFSADACQAIQAPAISAGQSDRPLAEPARHEDVAQQVCVMRVWNTEQHQAGDPFEERVASGAVQTPAVLDRLVALLRTLPGRDETALASRQRQVDEYRRQWERWSPRVAAYKSQVDRDGFDRPHFGEFEDQIGLQSLTSTVGEVIANALSEKKEIQSQNVAGYIGGSLEAYFRCIADGKSQLETTYTTSTELQTRAPLLRARAREQLVQACQQGVSALESERARYEALKRDLDRDEQGLKAAAVFVPVPRQSQTLNLVACTP